MGCSLEITSNSSFLTASSTTERNLDNKVASSAIRTMSSTYLEYQTGV